MITPRSSIGVVTFLMLALFGRPALAADASEYIGKIVVSVRIQIEGRPTDEPALREALETPVGQPLAMDQVRESIVHLFGLGRFEDVRVEATATPTGVALLYELVPLHAVAAIEFRGDLGLGRGELRRAVTNRFGAAPTVGQAAAAALLLEALHADHGYLSARVSPRTEVEHVTERSTLVFEVEAGPRWRLGRIDVRGEPIGSRDALMADLGIKSGAFYDRLALQRAIDRRVEAWRRQGHYEASITSVEELLKSEQAVNLTLTVQPGPLVTVRFTGDPIPRADLSTLVPISGETSVDEDLLEDSARRIAGYLSERGYWRARVSYTRQIAPGKLDVVFHVVKGRLYEVKEVTIAGNASVALAELRPVVQLAEGEPFVASRLDATVSAIAESYRRRGFANVVVNSDVAETIGHRSTVSIRVVVNEGPRTLVREIVFEGHTALEEATLRANLRTSPGSAFYAPMIALDRETILLEYLNRGYQTAEVEPSVSFSTDGSLAAVKFVVNEGEQVLVGHVLITGYTRTKLRTIARELTFRRGSPLTQHDILESQRRLSGLGLFRRVRITELPLQEGGRRDLLVSVEEAPATAVAYGAGIEGGKRLRLGPSGQAVERLEFAPRGSFEIGRRNLWGKNRAINLFTRVGVRPRGDAETLPQAADGRAGFVEYRALGTYREPRIFGTAIHALLTGFAEQGARSSFNFSRRGTHAELTRRIAPVTTFIARYSLDRTKLFDERFSDEDKLVIDRLFPQVRLSAFSGALIRDTRDDEGDPTRGVLVSYETKVAGRAIGSEVGFVKSFGQLFLYRRLAGTRSVFAGGVRLGLAGGFARDVVALQPGGPTIVVDDLPASERFFAGGDTTVRGFALDSLGARETIDPRGFPKGGNAIAVLNAELRVPVWRSIGAVVFVDAGNVFARAEDLDLGELRGAVGFGLRVRSPVGPVRFDLGFKLDRRSFGVPPTQESRTAAHFSIGHAF